MIDCINLDNFALTHHVSRYNEDGLTAQQLLIKSAKTCKKAVETLKAVAEGIDSFNVKMSTSYNPTAEELAITQKLLIPYETVKGFNRYYFLFNENGKTAIELAGNVNNAINNSLEVTSSLLTVLGNIEGLEDDLKELQSLVDSFYIDTFDTCAMTVLELAGNTAKNVNDFVNIVNKFVNTVDRISIGYVDETLIAVVGEDNEILEL